MNERFEMTSPEGSRDTLSERRSALSRDLLGDERESGKRRTLGRATRAGSRKERPSTSTRKIRVPEMALGLSLVLGGSLAAVTLASKGEAVIEVVGLGAPLARGEAVTADKLIVVKAEARFVDGYVMPKDASNLVGRVALNDLRVGAPIPAGALAATPVLGPDEEIVALRIELGDVPEGIGIGDNVRIAMVPDPSLSTEAAPEEYQGTAVVWSVATPSETTADYIVSLRVARDFLAKAASAQRIKLAMTPNDPVVAR